MKLARRPKPIPIVAPTERRSRRIQMFFWFFLLNRYRERAAPMAPPWKDMPPCQMARILVGFWR